MDITWHNMITCCSNLYRKDAFCNDAFDIRSRKSNRAVWCVNRFSIISYLFCDQIINNINFLKVLHWRLFSYYYSYTGKSAAGQCCRFNNIRCSSWPIQRTNYVRNKKCKLAPLCLVNATMMHDEMIVWQSFTSFVLLPRVMKLVSLYQRKFVAKKCIQEIK